MIENDLSRLMRQICKFNIHYMYKWIFILSRAQGTWSSSVITILKKYDRCGGCWIATYAYATNFPDPQIGKLVCLYHRQMTCGALSLSLSLGLGNFSHSNLNAQFIKHASLALTFLTSRLYKIEPTTEISIVDLRFTRDMRGRYVERTRHWGTKGPRFSQVIRPVNSIVTTSRGQGSKTIGKVPAIADRIRISRYAGASTVTLHRSKPISQPISHLRLRSIRFLRLPRGHLPPSPLPLLCSRRSSSFFSFYGEKG